MDLTQAILSLRPNASWTLIGENYENLEWTDANQTKPTYEELVNEWNRLQSIYNNLQYQRNRSDEYPSIEAQLDMMYWDKINGTNVWVDTITAIKAKYPKP